MDENFNSLSKKERIKLKRELEQQKEDHGKKRNMIIKWLAIILVVGLLILGGWWVIAESSKPLPGKTMVSQGRDHVPQAKWEKFKYNSNPPASGSHDVVWTKSGIYDTPQGDGHLVHSLEHGYIVISYNCTKLRAKVADDSSRLGSNNKKIATPSGLAMTEDTKACEDLKKELVDIANKNKLWKLIVVPRPNMDSVIALTAWTKIATLPAFDSSAINRFVDSYRDGGPEKTME